MKGVSIVKDLFEVAIKFTQDGVTDIWSRNYWATSKADACRQGSNEFRGAYNLRSVRILSIDASKVMG